MKAYLIDPFERAITEVDYSGNYQDIYGLCGYDTFTVVTFNDQGDGVYVDDEGLFKSDQKFFVIGSYPQPLAGRGLVLGVDDEGASVSPTVDMTWLENHVRFVELIGGYHGS